MFSRLVLSVVPAFFRLRLHLRLDFFFFFFPLCDPRLILFFWPCVRYHPYLLKCHETITLLDVPTAGDTGASSPPERGNF